ITSFVVGRAGATFGLRVATQHLIGFLVPAQSLERLAPAIEDATEFRPERGNPAVFFDGFLVTIESAKHLATVNKGIIILSIKLCRYVVFLHCFLVRSQHPQVSAPG